MIWNVSLLLVPVFLILSLGHIYFGDSSWLTSAVALMVSCVNLLYMKGSRRYELIGILATISATIIVQFSHWLMSDSRLISDTMWCILVGFFAYFIFERRIGTLVLLLNLTGLLLFLWYGDKEMLAKKGNEIIHADFKMALNVYYVAIALAFIISKMIRENNDTRKRYEEEIRRNEVLLKEIHHRVKNNLQIISSLLNLQADELNDQRLNEHFGEAIGRIRSMALIHEKMYQRDDLSRIDLKEYILSLAADITASISSDSNIEIKLNSEIEEMDVKNVVPLSLIFNELITNSVKHGFKNRRDGRIEIEILRNGDQVVIHYSDNGEWSEPVGQSTFGLELLETFTQQLEGKCERSVSGGTHYHFSFGRDVFNGEH